MLAPKFLKRFNIYTWINAGPRSQSFSQQNFILDKKVTESKSFVSIKRYLVNLSIAKGIIYFKRYST